jgi:RNA polymerase sigma-70 factor (ECF subfamily)
MAKKLYYKLFQILGDRDEPYDVLQDVFFAVWEKAESGELKTLLATIQSPGSWINGLAKNRAIDRLRRGKRYEPIAPPAEFDDPDGPDHQIEDPDHRTPEVEIDVKETRQEVRRAMLQLTPQQQSELDLYYFGGLSMEEVAAQFNLPFRAMQARFRKSRMDLAKILRPRMEYSPQME